MKKQCPECKDRTIRTEFVKDSKYWVIYYRCKGCAFQWDENEIITFKYFNLLNILWRLKMAKDTRTTEDILKEIENGINSYDDTPEVITEEEYEFYKKQYDLLK